MLTDELPEPEATTPAAVRAEYESELAGVVSAAGVETAARETGLDADRLRALVDGDPPTLTLEETARILALEEERPAAEDLLVEVRDNLMLQMSSAVMDVESLAAELDGDLDAKEYQQKLEGRQPMTLAEYARVYRFLQAENPY